MSIGLFRTEPKVTICKLREYDEGCFNVQTLWWELEQFLTTFLELIHTRITTYKLYDVMHKQLN